MTDIRFPSPKKAGFIGESTVSLEHGKIYDYLGIEMGGMLRIIDESGVDDDEEAPGYLYPPQFFKIVVEEV